jgi:hypothetical protein
MILKDLKKVPHYGTPQSRKRLSADRDYLTLVSLAVSKDYPKQDIESFS